MRQIRDRSCTLAEHALFAEFVDHQREDNIDWRRPEHIEYIQQKRIADEPPAVFIAEEALEVCKADPLAAENALFEIVIFKCHKQADHGLVHKQEEHDNSWYEHDVQDPVLPHIAPCAASTGGKPLSSILFLCGHLQNRISLLCPKSFAPDPALRPDRVLSIAWDTPTCKFSIFYGNIHFSTALQHLSHSFCDPVENGCPR